MPKRAMEVKDIVRDFQKTKRGQKTPLRETGETTFPPRGTTRTSISFLHSWTERINIRSSQDEIDPDILEKLLAPSAIAAASVHKYWTSSWAKTADNAELLEMLKLAEMYTSQYHVLNCELYKVLTMKIDELHSTVVGAEDIDEKTRSFV
ncbi:Uncharacterized protein Fot_07151 [Forsythia ovata]|uniref:Uncharacterized protein n=1 Tax=Forsythia ovata TaxID=205694 RepID=A0ABD1WVC0_9LAMI